jgi:hypothetical protein
VPGLVARTAAGTTSGALTGAGSAALSGDNPIRGMVEGGAFGGGISVGSQLLQRALQTLRGTYVPPEVRAPDGTWSASDETATRAKAAQVLLNNNVPVTTQQVSRDPALLPADAPWSGQSGDTANAQQEFRRAALTKVNGGNASNTPTIASDQFVADQTTRLGQNYDDLAARNNIDFNGQLNSPITQFSQKLNGIDKDTREAIKPYINTVLNSVSKDPTTGAPIISGAKYMDLTNSKSDLEKLAAGGGLPGQYGQELLDMLGKAFKQSASPADQALFETNNAQYRALQAVKTARGENGSFEPKDLSSATKAQSDRYGDSTGTLDELANAGTTVLQPSYGGGAGKALAGVGTTAAGAGIPAAAIYAGTHALPGLLGLGAPALPAVAIAGGLPLVAQAFSRNPQNVARAIATLRGAPNYAPYRLPRQVVAPGVVAGQQN